MIQAILQDKSLEWMEDIFKMTLLKAKLFYEERIKITEVRGIREVRKLKERIMIIKIGMNFAYGKVLFFAGINIHEACIIRI